LVDKTPRKRAGLTRAAIKAAAGAAPTRAVQNAQREAAIGMSLMHSGHARVFTSTAGAGWKRAISAFTGLMTKKNTTAAMIRNAIRTLRNSPYRNSLPLMVNVSPEKSGCPPIAAMSGVTRDLTSAVTTAPKAVPITTATASSTRFPRRMNSRNSFNIVNGLLVTWGG
jgi:hypothetical protein